MQKDSKTEIAAKALAYAELNEKGRAAFNSDYWKEWFAASERQEYRRRARIVIKALKVVKPKLSD